VVQVRLDYGFHSLRPPVHRIECWGTSLSDELAAEGGRQKIGDLSSAFCETSQLFCCIFMQKDVRDAKKEDLRFLMNQGSEIPKEYEKEKGGKEV
ncbi:MAG: hypothetical protein IKE08_01250, partial [Clostridia bacterium]|nr:hypothetical protein [Clostridia bacterium]